MFLLNHQILLTIYRLYSKKLSLGLNFSPPSGGVSSPSLKESMVKTINYFPAHCLILLLQEIIEFPVLKVDAVRYDVISEFQEFVKPVRNPRLTEYCTSLTSITQVIIRI